MPIYTEPKVIDIVSVPLSGLSSFNVYQPGFTIQKRFWVSVPLSGLSSFNKAVIIIVGAFIIWFPSPYRGYHLSTVTKRKNRTGKRVFPPPYRSYHLSTWRGDLCTQWTEWFPSPYRGYHLSTGMITSTRIIIGWGFRPLIGVIIFQHSSPISTALIFTGFPSPYRGYHLSTWKEELSF